VSSNGHDRALDFDPAIGGSKSGTVPGAWSGAREATRGARESGVPGIFVTDPGEVWHLARGTPT